MLTEVKTLEKIKCIFVKFIIKSLIANSNRCVYIMLNIFAYVDIQSIVALVRMRYKLFYNTIYF